MTDEEKKEPRVLALSERAVNWAKALSIILPLVGAAFMSTLGYFKSNSADEGVDRLVVQLDKKVKKQAGIINKQSDKLEMMARRLIFFQAHQEGRTSGRMQAKIDRLERELDAVKVKKVRAAARWTPPPPRPAKKPIVQKRSKSPLPELEQIQSIPRLKPRPFNRKGD
jgi:ABC-type phosphate transport system auxiliary subunit